MALTSSRIYNLFCFSVSRSGLTAIAENCTEAKNILHERYGNTRVQIIALVNYFISFHPVKSMNTVSGLPNLIDKLEK